MPRKKLEEMTEDEKQEFTEREAEKQRLEQEYQTKAKEQQEALLRATEAKAKAEAMLETMQKMTGNQQQVKEWTPEQWTEFTEKTGLTKDQLMIVDNIAKNQVETVRSEFSQRAKQAEDRATQAEERVKTYEKDKSYDGYKKDYFSKNPAYGKYERDFDEFVGAFPAEIKNDPAKLADIFSKAAIYVKGKVGEKVMKNTGGGTRFGDSDDNSDNREEDTEIDLKDLRPHERLTVGKILPTKEGNERLAHYKHDLKGDDGVMISGKEEWDKYNKK